MPGADPRHLGRDDGGGAGGRGGGGVAGAGAAAGQGGVQPRARGPVLGHLAHQRGHGAQARGHAVSRAGHEGPRSFHNHGAEKAPTRAFSLLKVPTSAWTHLVRAISVIVKLREGSFPALTPSLPLQVTVVTTSSDV